MYFGAPTLRRATTGLTMRMGAVNTIQVAWSAQRNPYPNVESYPHAYSNPNCHERFEVVAHLPMIRRQILRILTTNPGCLQPARS